MTLPERMWFCHGYDSRSFGSFHFSSVSLLIVTLPFLTVTTFLKFLYLVLMFFFIIVGGLGMLKK